LYSVSKLFGVLVDLILIKHFTDPPPCAFLIVIVHLEFMFGKAFFSGNLEKFHFLLTDVLA